MPTSTRAQPDEPPLILSVFLLRQDQVATFEAAVLTGRDRIDLAALFDGIFVPLPCPPAEPRWLNLVHQLLRTPDATILYSHMSPPVQ